MSKVPNTDNMDMESLRSAASKLVEALRNAKVGRDPLRLKSRFELIETDTRGWYVRIGTMGPGLPRLEIWLDRSNTGEQRLFWFGFSAKEMAHVGKARDVCKLPVAQQEIKDNDWVELNGGATQLKAGLQNEVFNKPIVELYDKDRIWYFGIYNKPDSDFNLELAKKFFVEIIGSLLEKDLGQVELAQYGFFRRLIRDRQEKFRKSILEAYNGACVLTGCEVESCLEAAHIDRFSDSFDNRITNGILLRADLHRLMDEGLMTFMWSEEKITAQINTAVKHEDYRRLNDKAIKSPSDKTSRPSKDNIERHRLKA